MKKNKDLSIIIPVYNVQDYIERCVRSCENQNIDKCTYELICVNDGSWDNSLKILEKLADEYDNIVITSQPNGGLSSARNTGMRNAHGKYYMFVDADDWIAPNCLYLIVEKLKKDNPDALVICAANIIGEQVVRRMSYNDETPLAGSLFLEHLKSPCAPFSIWSSSFLKENNLVFYEGILHEDSEFTPRAYYLANTISRTNELIYYVFQNPNSITRTVNPQKSYDLVEVVCEHLSEFCEKTVAPEHKFIFHKMISMYLNNALANIVSSNKTCQTELNTMIYRHKKLFSHLIRSTKIKYKVEGILFYLFPKHYVGVYKIMKKIS